MPSNWFDLLWAVALLPLMFWLAGSVLRNMPDEAESEPALPSFFSKAENRPLIKRWGPGVFRAGALVSAALGAALLRFVPGRVLMAASGVEALAVLAGCLAWLYVRVRRGR